MVRAILSLGVKPTSVKLDSLGVLILTSLKYDAIVDLCAADNSSSPYRQCLLDIQKRFQYHPKWEPQLRGTAINEVQFFELIQFQERCGDWPIVRDD